MLALRSLEAPIRPERGTHTRPPSGIARTRSVSGIDATCTPAGLEREPRAAGYPFDVVAFCLLVFRLPFLQPGVLLLLLTLTLLPFVHPPVPPLALPPPPPH